MNQIPPNMGVVVGLPFSRQVMPEWGISLATQAWPTGLNICYVPVRCHNPETGSIGPLRAQGRELIANGAIELKAPYVLMVDDDVELPFGAARQLLQTLKQADSDVMAVGGIYCTKQDRPEPIVYQTIGHGAYWKWKKDTIFPCELIGTGCMLIKTEAFEHIEKPWFKDVDQPGIQLTDDTWFCGKLKQAGLKVLADAHVICTHWDNAKQIPYRLGEDTYPMIPSGKEQFLLNLPYGWMTGVELAWLSDRASEHECIVELGCYLGRSTVAMARSTAGEVWAIDDFRGLRCEAADQYHKPPADILAAFKTNVDGLANVFWIRTDHADYSTLPPEWIRGADIEKPDMIFIDGSHEYENVKRDIMAWKERLRLGGLLCGHDHNWPGVRKALNELLPGWTMGPGSVWIAP